MGPQIAIYNSTNTDLVYNWDVGTLKAQRPSDVLSVKIWNNKGGATAVSDLKECYLMVLDGIGDTANDDVAKDKWVQVNVPSMDGNTNVWEPIGGTSGKNLKCDDATVPQDECTIYGEANDGIEAHSPKNVATVNLRVVAPPNSTPGDKNFKCRIVGWFS